MKRILLIILISASTIIVGCSNQSNNKKETVNKKIDGFSIPLPQNWIDKTNLSIIDNLSKFDFEEEELTKLIQSHNGSLPVAIYMKYDPTEYAGPFPTIQVNLRPNKNNNFEGFKKDMQVSISQMNNYFGNFQILKPIEVIEIDGIKGISFISQFELPNQQGGMWTIRSWSYGFPSGKYFFQINFSDTKTENSEMIYNEIINEVKFSK